MNKYFVDGIGIWADDERFIREILIENEYKYLYDYDTVVDLGANIGTFSLWIYPHAKRIYAVEPNPKAMKLLEQTIKDNKLYKIIPVEAAVTGTNGERYLKDTEDVVYGSGTINDGEGLVVKSLTIDALMNDHNIAYIDLLKVDIETSEVELFASSGFKSVANRIGTIVGEYHNGGMGKSIEGSLNGAGYRFEDLTKANSSGKFIARRL